MGLWKFECLKFWKNKPICALIFCCFLLNGILVFKQTKSYDGDSRCFPETIKNVYDELQAVSKEEQTGWLNGRLEQMERTMIEMDAMEDAVGIYERRNALRHVSEHVQAVYGYGQYLDGIKEQAEVIAGSSLFADQDVFSKRNAELIPQKYSHLHGIKLKADNPQGILLATESRVTDMILAALIVILFFFFFGMEREEGAMAFVRCAKYGGTKLGMSKTAVVFAGSLFGTLFLYLGNFAIAGAVYGFGDMGRWIQSVEGYMASPWKITVGRYLILFLLAKTAAAVAIAGIVIWIALWGKDLLMSGIALLGVTALEYGLYTAILPHSWLDIFKQCNLFRFMETERFFQSYDTVNLFQYPFSSVWVCCAVGAAVFAASVRAIWVSYENAGQSEYTRKHIRKHVRTGKKRLKAHSLLYYEAYKTLWVSGAGILLAGFLVLQFAVCSGGKAYFTTDELYYENYMKKLEGEVTEEKLKFIREERKRIDGLKKEQNSLITDGMDGQEMLSRRTVLERQPMCEQAFLRIEGQAERIGKDGVFLNEVGYGYLLDVGAQVRLTGELLLVLILAFHSVFVIEKTPGMHTVFHTVPNGKKRIWKRKWCLLAISILLLCAAADSMAVIYRMKSQGLTALNVPIRYLSGFEMWEYLSVGGYLAILCMVKMAVGLTACAGIEKISGKVKNATTVLLVSGSMAGGVLFAVMEVCVTTYDFLLLLKNLTI